MQHKQTSAKLVHGLIRVYPPVIAVLFCAALIPVPCASGAMSASTAQLQVGTVLFSGMAGAEGSGDLVAREINVENGAVDGDIWRAAEKLDNRNTDIEPRAIFTHREDANCGIPFSWDQLSEAQKQLLGGDDDVVPGGRDLLDYIAGNRSLEGTPHFRVRESRLGAIVNSRPVYHDGMVYVGSNDGMLHGFDARTGNETFAYIPNRVFHNLPSLADPESARNAFVDGTPFITDIQSGSESQWTGLVGGLGKGGKGIFCLDVTRARSLSPTMSDAMSLVKWEFSDADHLGYTTGRPIILNTRAGYVVMVGNGVDSARGEAVIFALAGIHRPDPSVFRFHTGVSGQNGIKGDITAIDANNDGFADFVYAGDYHGNIWKLDIRDARIENWDFAYQSHRGPQPVFSARCGNGNIQPVTTAVDVMAHCLGDRKGYILLFGTGDADPRFCKDNACTNTIYGLWDWQEQWEDIGGHAGAGTDKSFGAFARPGLEGLEKYFGDTFGWPGIRALTLLSQTIEETRSSDDETWMILSGNAINWWGADSGGESHVGWYVDLPNPGERIVYNPAFRSGVAVVMSAIPEGGSDGDETYALYMLDPCSGGEPLLNRFDVNRDGRVTAGDTITDSQGNERRPGGIILESAASLPLLLYPFIYYKDDESEKIHTLGTHEYRSGATYWYIPDYNWQW